MQVEKASAYFDSLGLRSVVLKGQIENQETKDWAIKIIEKTNGVIAVIDKLDSSISSHSVLMPAQNEVSKIYNQAYKRLPYIASAFILLFIFIFGLNQSVSCYCLESPMKPSKISF